MSRSEQDQDIQKATDGMSPCENEKLVGWDEALARPIYRRSTAKIEVEESPFEEEIPAVDIEGIMLSSRGEQTLGKKRAASSPAQGHSRGKQAKIHGVPGSPRSIPVPDTLSVATAIPSLANSESPSSASISSGLGSICSTPEFSKRRSSICVLSPRHSPSVIFGTEISADSPAANLSPAL